MVVATNERDKARDEALDWIERYRVAVTTVRNAIEGLNGSGNITNLRCSIHSRCDARRCTRSQERKKRASHSETGVVAVTGLASRYVGSGNAAAEIQQSRYGIRVVNDKLRFAEGRVENLLVSDRITDTIESVFRNL